MLPMNKICEDIREFLINRDRGEKLAVETEDDREKSIIIFAHVLSQKYNELVSVKLVKSLIVNIQDSLTRGSRNIRDSLMRGSRNALS